VVTNRIRQSERSRIAAAPATDILVHRCNGFATLVEPVGTIDGGPLPTNTINGVDGADTDASAGGRQRCPSNGGRGNDNA